MSLGRHPLTREALNLRVVERPSRPPQVGLVPPDVALDVLLARIGGVREAFAEVLADPQVIASPLGERGFIEPRGAQGGICRRLGCKSRPDSRHSLADCGWI